MDPTDLSDAQLDQLAQRLAPHLPTGTHGDNVILSRRAFAAAVGGTLGASGLVALGVDPAAAQAAGQVGTSSDPVDAFVFDLDVQNGATFNGTDIQNVGSLSTEELNTGVLLSGGFEGSSPDSRLGNALSAASNGDVIILENDSYVDDRTIGGFSSGITIKGSGVFRRRLAGTVIDGAAWSFDNRVSINDINMVNGASATLNGSGSVDGMTGTSSEQITVAADDVSISKAFGISIVFNSGAGGGVVDDSSIAVSVQDNDGSNRDNSS